MVDEGGFTAAADALGMSQPAVSQAVRELEEELGTPLVHRLGRPVSLTPAGEALLLPARQVHHDLHTARTAVHEVAELHGGHLDLACLPTLAVAPLAPLVGVFRSSYPKVQVVLSDPADTAELLRFVHSGRSEVGVVEHVRAPGLVTAPLWSQQFLAVLPPDSEADDPLPLRALAARPLVATPPGSSTRGLLDAALRRTGVDPTVAVEVAQREALLPLVLAGAGAALLPRALADLAATLGCVVVATRPEVARDVSLVHRDAPLTPAARRFVELALDQRLARRGS